VRNKKENNLNRFWREMVRGIACGGTFPQEWKADIGLNRLGTCPNFSRQRKRNGSRDPRQHFSSASQN
jgi:hypothetical protein